MFSGKEEKFKTGNQAVIEAAKTAGASIMCGYPITPATEILQDWSVLADKFDKYQVIQAEDETSAGFNVIGAIMAGAKAFTASAGPGHTLMQDPLSMAEAMRIPMVVIIMQRGGPSTGTVIYGQQELTMACFGGNGEGQRIVYSTSNPQDLYDYTLKAFYTAWKFRFPAIILGDGYQAKMQAKIKIHKHERSFKTEPITNEKNKNIRNCFNIESELAKVLKKHQDDFKRFSPSIMKSEQYQTHDAKKIIVAHGIVTGAAKEAINILQEKRQKVGLFRPITLRPFDYVTLSRLASQVKEMLIVESSYGHLERLVKAGLYGLTKIKLLQKPVEAISPEEIIKSL